MSSGKTDENVDLDDSMVTSNLDDYTLLELDLPKHKDELGHVKDVEIDTETPLPMASLLIVAETDIVNEDPVGHRRERSNSFTATLTDVEFEYSSKIVVKDWPQDKFYSDYIKEGLDYLAQLTNAGAPTEEGATAARQNVIMLYQSAASSSGGGDMASFLNREKYKFHDWPPPKDSNAKEILGPCKYILMNGSTYPAFLRGGVPPPGLVDHWRRTLPSIVQTPSFVKVVHEDDLVNAYLPIEQIKHHVNDPVKHYHLAGKDSIVMMTQKTTKLLPDTRTVRPCVVKTTHSMGSKGIFIVRNDEDEAKFEAFWKEAEEPAFVVTDFVDIQRNIACHFFIHPNGKNVTWFGSNENKPRPDGSFSTDSYLDMKEQAVLKKMQIPFVEEVVQYCHNLGFWGFCGVDVLFDSNGRGYLVDINPRVTGSCPALMTLQLFQKQYGFQQGFFRRSGDINYYGSASELLAKVDAYNVENEGKSRVVIHSFYEKEKGALCRLNIGVYGNDEAENKRVLNMFAHPPHDIEEQIDEA